jgi:lysophospholipase L1-like esterase
MRRFLPRAALLLFVLAAPTVSRSARAEDAAVALPAREKLHVYLLMGQSNMAGRGTVDPAQNHAHPRVLKLDKQGKWVPAVDPLHFDKPNAGVGPGSGFGPALAEATPDATIALVPCAVGGTPLSRWEQGGDLYQGALERARIAQKSGTLKGMIWHQGENDAAQAETAATYGPRLAKMIAALRKDLDAPDLPVVVGELGEFPRLQTEGAKTVNAALRAIPEQVPHAAIAKSAGLKAKSDGIHFDADGAREFGRRYAAAMRTLQAADKK